jgi:hypothetical protein
VVWTGQFAVAVLETGAPQTVAPLAVTVLEVEQLTGAA